MPGVSMISQSCGAGRPWLRGWQLAGWAVLWLAFTSFAQEKPFGVRNAFRATERPFLDYLPSGGEKVNEPGRAGIGDELRLEVLNFEQWQATQDSRLRQGELVLFLDRQPVAGLKLQPYAGSAWSVVGATGETNHISYFGVKLEQSPDNRRVWKQLLCSPDFELTRPIEVSLGYAGGEPMNSWVYPTAVRDGKAPFYLIILSAACFYFGLSVILGAFFIFVWLVRRTDLLRDPNLPLRPDGRRPLSLGRSQMAFWFFLVFSAFFLLWLATGYTDTLNSSTLTLIGISAATAVGSAFIDTGKRHLFDEQVVARKSAAETNDQILVRLQADLLANQQALTVNEADRRTTSAVDLLAAHEATHAKLVAQRTLLNRQIEFFHRPLWQVALHDLLDENSVISFHRFQMCVWTIVLGIIFVSDVYAKGAMPEFDATLLGLMGVSAGTFIGFKLPGQK